jgi:acyl-coenzyme A thioesterase PaaI-like protein
MSEKGLESGERKALGIELADQLRAAVADLSERDISDRDLAEAVTLANALRERLDGPRRVRWYEGDATNLAAENRVAYLDQSPIRGRLNPIAPPMRIDVLEDADGSRRVVGSARLGAAYEGPPRGVHGGWVAAMLDELLGTAQGLAEKQGVTATLKIRFRNITPIDEELRFEARVTEDRGRILRAVGTCHAGDTLTADAEGMFVRVDFNEVRERMKERGEA